MSDKEQKKELARRYRNDLKSIWSMRKEISEFKIMIFDKAFWKDLLWVKNHRADG
jgi:hypothetical protein